MASFCWSVNVVCGLPGRPVGSGIGRGANCRDTLVGVGLGCPWSACFGVHAFCVLRHIVRVAYV